MWMQPTNWSKLDGRLYPRHCFEHTIKMALHMWKKGLPEQLMLWIVLECVLEGLESKFGFLQVTSSVTSTSEIPSTSIENIATDDSETGVFYPEPLRKVKSMTCIYDALSRTYFHSWFYWYTWQKYFLFAAANGRLVLMPGDLVRCKYSFSPQMEGNFSVKRFIEVSGWPDSRVDINVTGICDLPRLVKNWFG